MIVLDGKSAMCMADNGNDTKHNIHIARRMHFVRYGEKCNLLAICMLCLVSLPVLAMHIEDLPSKTIKGASYGNMSGSYFSNSRINILKCAKAIPAMHAALYSLSPLD